jgi:hypothetical protein
MSENYPLGGTLVFTPDDEVSIAFTPAPITKAEALRIGVDFCEASDPEREALLVELGPVMVRRSLLVLSNVALRVGDTEAAAYARDLRDRIATERGESKAAS